MQNGRIAVRVISVFEDLNIVISHRATRPTKLFFVIILITR